MESICRISKKNMECENSFLTSDEKLTVENQYVTIFIKYDREQENLPAAADSLA